MTLLRTSGQTGILPIEHLSATAADEAHSITTYGRPGHDGTTTVVIEVRDAHENLLARSTIDTDATWRVAADFLLVDSLIERCSAWRTDPVHKYRRSIATVTRRLNDVLSDFEIERARVGYA